ncbi:hypothetical protein UWK_01938 [Desulfocapsa sulfexigens DSM 10523]|uniref:Uncharacterized protein n=1 Tax=Desulfocapsa sulfexigens (strain DSM 10523 / SB164P1) TaxID=1167006 RepID=M1P4V7_DESSD|nr:hypothetical protein [Desulfocapsa sulfexigens]AGF78488.1 hypothetical protein UWK_01938 [Desulfocapsa sulfexigens DSM 10523]
MDIVPNLDFITNFCYIIVPGVKPLPSFDRLLLDQKTISTALRHSFLGH